jgi:deoxyadenosine/deoxycytidine kinase
MSMTMPGAKYFVTVAGNIGAGKSSLTRLIAERLQWHAWYESVRDNPYLADFYQDMRTWSFHLQAFFLGHRAEHHLRLASLANSVIQDRSIYEDRYIFAPALHRLGNLSDRDFQAYTRLYGLVIEQLPAPSLLIYLRASVETLMERITQRARGIESGITSDYLTLLNDLYEEWIPTFALCPVMTIPSDRLDFVNVEHHLSIISERILARLWGQEEIVFPDSP